MNPEQSQVLFAPGDITSLIVVLTTMREVGTTGLSLIYRHDWAENDDQQVANQAILDKGDALPLVCRYRLPGGIEIVVTTMYVHTPVLHWTDLCLADEVIAAEADTEHEDTLEPVEDAALILEELSATEYGL